MPSPLAALAWTFLGTTLILLAGTGVLHLIPRLGAGGKALAKWLCAGYPLDAIVGFFTALPFVVGPVVGHLLGGHAWIGLLGAVLGMYAALIGWTIAHELAHPAARRGPRIIAYSNGRFGTARNLAATFATSAVVPLFWLTRMAEIFLYPVLTALVGLPKYEQTEWVNVSRHKFSNLVGHDRIWCLYCDWMTGIWSLGSEMLRNVESFWCPIRYGGVLGEAKCENCRLDFPDVNAGWVPADGTMADVVGALHAHYDDQPNDQSSWWGHPDRKPVQMTVRGREQAATVGATNGHGTNGSNGTNGHS